MKPARDRSYYVPYLYYLLVCICLPTIEESVDLDMVPLDGLFWSGFDSEYRSIVLPRFADIVLYQLRLSSSTEPHTKIRTSSTLSSLRSCYYSLIFRYNRGRKIELGGWSEGRVGIIALIRARGYLVSSRRIYLNGCQLT